MKLLCKLMYQILIQLTSFSSFSLSQVSLPIESRSCSYHSQNDALKYCLDLCLMEQVDLL